MLVVVKSKSKDKGLLLQVDSSSNNVGSDGEEHTADDVSDDSLLSEFNDS